MTDFYHQMVKDFCQICLSTLYSLPKEHVCNAENIFSKPSSGYSGSRNQESLNQQEAKVYSCLIMQFFYPKPNPLWKLPKTCR
ncbi:hypothetical protein BH24BAC1_BH24BAC1_04360 [soil metagenome]